MTGAPHDRDSDLSLVTSSFCTGGSCVGVRFTPDGVEVIDTKEGMSSLHFDRTEWVAFLAGVKNGEFDGV